MDILSNLVKMGLTLKYLEFDLCSFDGKYGSGREKARYAAVFDSPLLMAYK